MLMFHQRHDLDGFQKHVLEMLDNLETRIKDMALNLTNLTAAATKIVADNTTLIGLVQQLLAANPDSAVQAQLDAITTGLSTGDAAVLAEIAVLSATGPTGSTGTTGTTGTTGVSGATGA